MTWKETGRKGTFSRPIGENESFIKLLGDAGLPLNREHWAINSTATIKPIGSLASANLEALFKLAWAHLRFQHPSIAIEAAADNKNFLYTVPVDGVELDTWVSQTFSVARDAHSAADVIPTFQPTPYAKLVYIPLTGELLGHTAHWRSDGFGVLLLLDAFLSLASSHFKVPLGDPALLPWGEEVNRLAPAVEHAAAVPQTSTPQLKERASRYVGTFGHAAGAIGIPYLGSGETMPAGTRSASIVLSPEVTANVVVACKDRGATVTAAVHASVAGANFALANTAAKEKHYASTIRFALRPHLSEPYSTPAYAAGLYTTGWMSRVEPQATWSERLQSYQTEYFKGITREFLDSHREYALQLNELIRNMPPGGDPPSNVDISSVGIAEKLIQRSYGTTEAGLGVQAVSVGVEMLTRQAVTFVWTFRDQLNLHVVYNEAYHSSEQMGLFVAAVKAEFLRGLGVGE